MWLIYRQMVLEPYDEKYVSVLDEFRIAETSSRQPEGSEVKSSSGNRNEDQDNGEEDPDNGDQEKRSS
jgi:hypothetical protein